jgi:cytochrome c peroxidase
MTRQSMRRTISVSLATAGVILAATGAELRAQSSTPQGTHVDGQLSSLKNFPPPLPDLAGVITSDFAYALGKALFWDAAAGSDGQACASCHFHAGADPRTINAISPGLRAVPPDATFQKTVAGADGGPNYHITGAEFPLHQLADPTDAQSGVLFDTNDTIGSAGTYAGAFNGITLTADHTEKKCTTRPMDEFHIAATGTNAPLLTRQVEPRNTPSVINAAFNLRQFWDGRANNVFNGANPFGPRDASARIVMIDPATGKTGLQPFQLSNASLASQAVGPALSDFEMSCTNRTFADLGRKLEFRKPLSGQVIDAQDSMFGQPSLFGDIRFIDPQTGIGRGLAPQYTYVNLIKQSFDPRYWSDTRKYRIDTTSGSPVLVADPVNGYTQLELNFSMFWGVSIMLYESTLISDDSPFDRYMDAGAPGVPDPANPGFGAAEIRGLDVFSNAGACIHCHDGPLFTRAAIGVNRIAEDNVVERMTMADGTAAFYDNGFYNIGTRASRDDQGVGALDPFGYPLSFTRQFVGNGGNAFNSTPDQFQLDPCTWDTPFPNCTVFPDTFGPLSQRVVVDGAFKVPTLRNVGLTAPYFHNGGQGTLLQVVQFYSRGGDARNVTGGDTSGSGVLGEDSLSAPASGSNLHPLQFRRNLTTRQQLDLVFFLKSLTDDRVRCHAAPFDHPELTVSHGSLPTPGQGADGRAAELTVTVAATGALGIDPAKCAQMPNVGMVDHLPLTLKLLTK